MVKYEYVGKIGPYTGKRLFEILANLKNNGKGRIVQRLSEIKESKNGKENFYKIIKSAPQMDNDLAFGEAWAEQVKDGKKVPFFVKLKTTIPDYQLVLKNDEEKLLNKDYPIYGQTEEDVLYLDKKFKTPPLLAEFLNKNSKKKDLNLLKHGLSKENDGYDKNLLIDFDLPYVYDFNEYEEICRKVFKD